MMGISSGARSGRIDKHYTDLAEKFNSLNSKMQAVIREARQATAFMHDNPNGEFNQEDRDKYSDLFTEAISSPNGFFGCIDLLQPMLDVEQGTKTPAEFVAEEEGYDAVEYSAQFNRG
jgi:hypothetical protein